MYSFRFLLNNVDGVKGVLSTSVNACCEEEAYDIIFDEYGEDVEVLECTCTGPAFDEDAMRYGDF
jgi:hypothetical protein